MDWIQVIILGVVQGLTEFLPVSSSGHLVLAQHILGVNEAGVLLEVILHMGTLVAILLYFKGDRKAVIKAVASEQGLSEERIRSLAISFFNEVE